MMELINWQEIVKEAKRRRREEGLTQKAHANLAGVSIPTIIAFDRGETTLSIQKTLDILNVVNMVVKKRPMDKLTEFIFKSRKKWEEHIKDLPENCSARHSSGYHVYAFCIDGLLKKLNTQEFKKILKEVAEVKYSGWTPFWYPQSEYIAPYINDDDNIECWLGKKYLKKENQQIFSPFDDSPNDFWCASRQGLMYLQRAYTEDCTPDILTPKTIIDLSLPIRQIVEIICYADRFRRAMSEDITQSSINLRIFYTGLKGRKLANWTDPSAPIFIESSISEVDEVEIEIKFSLSDSSHEFLHEEIAKLTSNILSNLYSKFNFFQLDNRFIISKVKQTLSLKKPLI